MKRVLGRIAVLILILGVITFGVNPAQVQAATLTPSPSSGTPGSIIGVTGSGFTANETVSVTWDGTAMTTALVNALGSFTVTFTIPPSPSGSHTIAATSPSATASVPFQIVSNISLNQTSGPVGTSITVTGVGFGASETGIQVAWDGTNVASGLTASAQGGWTATFAAPAAASGAHSIHANGNTTPVTRDIAFNITPAVTLDRTSGAPGNSVTVTGTGFSASEGGITITWDGTPVRTGVSANAQGGWTATFDVPAAPAGNHNVHAYGNVTLASATQDIPFIVGAGISVPSTSGPPGTSMTVTGSGFATSEGGITVTWDGTNVASGIRANAQGGWTTTFVIPNSPSGSHTIRASGATTTTASDVSFTVTPAVNTNQPSGTPGTSLTVTGAGFAANESGITVTWDGTNVASGIRANAQGSWTSTFLIPASTSGAHAIHASGSVTSSTSTQDVIFTVNPGISLSQTSGPPGASITVTGAGFSASETGIIVTYDGTSVASGIRANATGSWNTNITIPASASGPHIFHTSGSVTLAASTSDVTFTVTPSVSVNPASASPGTSVTVTGVGFGASETGITVSYNGNAVASGIRANAQGGWTSTFVIPPSPAGSHSIAAAGAVTQASTVSAIGFTSAPGVTLTPATGYVGATVQVNGAGFAVNSPITLAYDNTQIQAAQGVTTDATGSFNQSITIPKSKGGPHTITVTDAQKNSVRGTFTMDTTTPPVPSLTSPDDGGRVGILGGTMPTLNWSRVTDPSGVTYELEIDTNSDFSQPVLDKTEIPANRYTLTASEALPLGDYYWRVRTVDGASNTSDWSPARLLKSGLMPLTTLIIILVVGAAAVGVAAYFLLRRLPARGRERAMAVPQGEMPRVVVTGQWRSLEAPEETPRERPLPLRLALPQPTKGTKTLSTEDQARLKVIVDFAQSIPLVDGGYNVDWLLDLLESGTGIEPTIPIYEQLFKGDLQVKYEPAWIHHPTYQDLTSLLEGQPVLQDLNAFVEAVNRCASEATSLLQDVYRDTITEIPQGLLERGGWGFISGVYADATSWFLGKSLRDPSERDYSVKPRSGPLEESETLWLFGEETTAFAGPLIQASDEKEAAKLRGLHLKLRRNYRNNPKAKEVVTMMTQLEVQRSRLLNVFSQFGRLKQ